VLSHENNCKQQSKHKGLIAQNVLVYHRGEPILSEQVIVIEVVIMMNRNTRFVTRSARQRKMNTILSEGK
jgi:predicted nucleic-acid-binding protein